MKNILLACLFTLPVTINAQSVTAGKDIAIVSTESGPVKGYTHDGIFTYKGIPYATADRFMAPIKPTPWTTVRSSMTYGPVCPIDPTTNVNDENEFAFNHNWGYMNENCLSLNVWTQAINNNKKQPVMVWLHGGGFSAGSSIELPSYDGESLAKKGVVLVSVNHRLNALGFLDMSAYGDKYKSSANAGLLDLVAALQWVKQNIAAFGGDPDNVTIFGQSGGGGKVTCLMNAPSAKGLFHKAIVQSGSYVKEFMDPVIAKKVSAAILQQLSLQPAQVDSLQKISYAVLSAVSKKAFQQVQQELKAAGKPVAGFGLGWGPILDGQFLPYQPSTPEATAISNNLPLLVGSTKTEFAPFNPATRNISIDSAKTLLQKTYGEKTAAYMAEVKAAYPSTAQGSDYTDIDFRMRPGVVQQASNKAAVTGAAPVYAYLFTWESPVNDGIYKSMHCMDLAFQFDNIARCQEMTGGGKDAYTLAAKISQAWINFATTGNPNAKGLPQWPAYTSTDHSTMLFDNKCEVKKDFDKALLDIAAPK